MSINNKWIPEVDLSYFFTPNIVAELILTYPQKHEVRLGGDTLCTLKHLPPSLLVQYHFTDRGAFKPYVGAGVNYTRFSSVKLPDGLDVKTVYIDTTVSGVGKFKADPVLFGVGVGYRF